VGVLLAHVISFKLDVNKGVKSIMESISAKLGTPNVVVSQITNTTPVKKELADLDILYRNIKIEEDVRYEWNKDLVNSHDLIESLSELLFYEGKFILGRAIELKGISTTDYIAMVDECGAISKKYSQPVQTAAIVGF
jgi:hypothetical protein